MNCLEAVSQMLRMLNDGDAVMQCGAKSLPVELFPTLNHPFPGKGETRHFGFGILSLESACELFKQT